MEKSVILQETALRQWLAIENWQAMPYKNTRGVTTLHIQFEIISPANSPLTLKRISTKIDGEAADSTVSENLLPPDHHYTAAAYVGITIEQLQKMDEATLVLPVAITIVYEDVLQKERVYPKNGMLAFSVSFHTFHGPGIYMERGKNNKAQARKLPAFRFV